MITYDYLIERKTSPVHTDKFTPKIPTELSSIVSIEGPNSLGKSTLLHIIALGLYGNRNARINPALQSKMNSLLDAEHQKLKFSFEIISEMDGLRLRSEKKDPSRDEIIVSESTDGKSYSPIIWENFEKKYNVIYDIPSNPTERLPELLKELKDEQRHYGTRFRDFSYFLHNTITQINTSRNSKRMQEVVKILEEQDKNKRKLEDELPSLNAFLELLEKKAYIFYNNYYMGECYRIEKQRGELSDQIVVINNTGKKIIKKVRKEKTRIEQLRSELEDHYHEVTPKIEMALPHSLKSRFSIWKEINPYSIDKNDISSYLLESLFYQNKFEDEKRNIVDDPSFKDASSYEKILISLKEFEDSNLQIPQLKVTLGELIKIIKQESKNGHYLIERYNNIAGILQILSKIIEKCKQLQDALKEYKEESDAIDELSSSADQYELDRERLRKLNEDLENARSKWRIYSQRCTGIGIDEKALKRPFLEIMNELPKNDQVDQYLSLSEGQVMNKIAELKENVKNKCEDLNGLKISIGMYQKEKNELESLEPHKYEPYYDKLNEMLIMIKTINQKILEKYEGDLNKLIHNQVKEDDLKRDPKSKHYFDEVSMYLAKRIGTFRHIDKSYDAKLVNLISKYIATEDGSTIYFTDMGTGQSQSAFLLGLLKAGNDDRKIIALFDEIAMMDETSLKPVYKRLQELYQQNRLLLGILVQKSQELKIQSLVEV